MPRVGARSACVLLRSVGCHVRLPAQHVRPGRFGRVCLIREDPSARRQVHTEVETWRGFQHDSWPCWVAHFAAWMHRLRTRRLACRLAVASLCGAHSILKSCLAHQLLRLLARPQVGRGESLGAVWALTGGTHDTSALAIRDSELVRMSKVRPARRAASQLTCWVNSLVRVNVDRSTHQGAQLDARACHLP